jgi:hypothetical protein
MVDVAAFRSAIKIATASNHHLCESNADPTPLPPLVATQASPDSIENSLFYSLLKN